MPPALCGLGTPLLAIVVAGIGTVLLFGSESLPVGYGEDSLVGVLVGATNLSLVLRVASQCVGLFILIPQPRRVRCANPREVRQSLQS